MTTPSSPLRSTTHLDLWTTIVLGAAVLAGLGSVLTWITLETIGTVARIDGLAASQASPVANGWTTLVLAGLGTIVCLLPSRDGASTFVVANAGFLVAFLSASFVLAPGIVVAGPVAGYGWITQPTVGVGPYLSLAGGLGMLVGSLKRYAATATDSSEHESTAKWSVDW